MRAIDRREQDAQPQANSKIICHPAADPQCQLLSDRGGRNLPANFATSQQHLRHGRRCRLSVLAELAGGLCAGRRGYRLQRERLGSGRSDLFQAGAYLRHTEGPAYISAALAYGWQDITTDRIVTAAGIDHLRAEFNANAWSGRMEGGYRFVAPWGGGIGLTPYAAAQFTTFDLPAYAEQVISGASTFALSYGSHSPTDTRTKLGLRSDKSFALVNAVLTLRGRLAWAHDFAPDRAIAATFQALPGASFVVNGAAQAADSALTTASAELKWSNGWSVAATFEGEFSNVTRSYAGKGVLRYASDILGGGSVARMVLGILVSVRTAVENAVIARLRA